MKTRKSRNNKQKCDCHIVKETTAKIQNRNKSKSVNKQNPSLNTYKDLQKKSYPILSHSLTTLQSKIPSIQYRKHESSGNFYIQANEDSSSSKSHTRPYCYILYPIKNHKSLKEIQEFDVAKKMDQNIDKISNIISIPSTETKLEKPSNSFLQIIQKYTDDNSSILTHFQPQILTSSQFHTFFLGKYKEMKSCQANPLNIKQILPINDTYININQYNEQETKFQNKTFNHLNEKLVEQYSYQDLYMQHPICNEYQSSDFPDSSNSDQYMKSDIDFETISNHSSMAVANYNKIMSENNSSYTHSFFPYPNAMNVELLDQCQYEFPEDPYISDNIQSSHYQKDKNYYDRFTHSPSGCRNKLLDYESFFGHIQFYSH